MVVVFPVGINWNNVQEVLRFADKVISIVLVLYVYLSLVGYLIKHCWIDHEGLV